jgi:NADPH2:quinone reductase
VLNRKGSLFLTRPTLGHYLLNRSEFLLRAGELFKWMAEGELKVNIDQVFSLSQAGDAHRYLEARKTKGKVILRV